MGPSLEANEAVRHTRPRAAAIIASLPKCAPGPMRILGNVWNFSGDFFGDATSTALRARLDAIHDDGD
jgi:hypothetical protein